MFQLNRSWLLVWTLLCFAGFHKQPSSAFLRGLLYLEVCKSCIAYGIELEIMTFRRSSLYFLFCALLYFSEDKKYFCILHYWFSQATVTAYHSTGLAKVQHVRLCCEHVGFCCKCWDCLWALVSIHRETSNAVVHPANACMETRLYTQPSLALTLVSRLSGNVCSVQLTFFCWLGSCQFTE